MADVIWWLARWYGAGVVVELEEVAAVGWGRLDVYIREPGKGGLAELLQRSAMTYAVCPTREEALKAIEAGINRREERAHAELKFIARQREALKALANTPEADHGG